MPRPKLRKAVAHAPQVSLSIDYATPHKAVLPNRAQCRRWLKAALSSDAQVGLRFVDPLEGRVINKAYRQKDYATNVLTFVYPSPKGQLKGDIVVCASVVEREAREQGKTLKDHYAHMLIHAALHLQGEDHENDTDALRMEALEVTLLRRFRVANPYL